MSKLVQRSNQDILDEIKKSCKERYKLDPTKDIIELEKALVSSGAGVRVLCEEPFLTASETHMEYASDLRLGYNKYHSNWCIVVEYTHGDASTHVYPLRDETMHVKWAARAHFGLLLTKILAELRKQLENYGKV